MKISRLHVQEFSINECPELDRPGIAGEDLVFCGGNRSGKTLSFNAILYGLYGRDATFDVPPGMGADVKIHFDNGDVIERGDQHTYQVNGESDDPEVISDRVGPERIVKTQFLHSDVTEQPLSSLHEEDLLWLIRTVINGNTQAEIERQRTAIEHLEYRAEMVRRGDGEKLSLQELEEQHQKISPASTRNRLKKVEHLWSLIDSGEIVAIRDRLERGDKIAERIKELSDRRRHLRDEIQKKGRELSEIQRYTDKVDSIIIDAIQDLPCPVCDSLVTEAAAKRRLGRSECPHCGQSRNISDLKSSIRERVDQADEKIESLEEEIDALEAELEEVDSAIEDLKAEEPDLREVDSLVERALESADYEIDTVREETREKLDQYQTAIEEDEELLSDLKEEISEREEMSALYEDCAEAAEDVIDELTEESHEEEIETFRDRWSENYRMLGPELAAPIGIGIDGAVTMPGTESDGPRDYADLSSGEKRLLNISFAFTLAELATEGKGGPNNWEVLVMDEPLTNLEEDIQKSAIEALLESEVQCILTTSNELIRSQVHDRNIKDLDRIAIDTTTLGDFI